MAKRTIRLSACITRNYGRVAAQFGAEADYEIGSDIDAARKYSELLGVVHFQFEEFEANLLKGEARDVSAPVAAMPGNQEWFTAARFVLEVKQGGKRFYSIQTKEPAFEKFGVACYPEFLEENNLIQLLGNDYSVDLPEGTRVLVDKSGKYKKAVKLVQSGKPLPGR